MKNHFIFSWPGNKRNEAEDFLKHADFEGIENIIDQNDLKISHLPFKYSGVTAGKTPYI